MSFSSEQLGVARFLPESHITTALPLGLLKMAQIWCRFLWVIMWIVVEEADVILELLNQKTRGCLVLIALKWLFFKHVH
jgi:hypothetical protein